MTTPKYRLSQGSIDRLIQLREDYLRHRLRSREYESVVSENYDLLLNEVVLLRNELSTIHSHYNALIVTLSEDKITNRDLIRKLSDLETSAFDVLYPEHRQP